MCGALNEPARRNLQRCVGAAGGPGLLVAGRVALLALCLVACAPTPQAPAALGTDAATRVHIPDPGEFVEVERTAGHSLVEVRRVPPGSVAGPMFILRGACAVARARGAAYVASTPVAGPVPAYRLTFPKTASDAQLRGPAKSVVSIADCDLLRF